MTPRALALRGGAGLRGVAALAANSYRAAASKRNRGGLSVPTAGADYHVDTRTRQDARELSRSLIRNAEHAAVLHSRWQDVMGVAMPRPASADPAWNEQVQKAFEARAKLVRGGFDAAERFAWPALQRQWIGHVGSDGEVYAILLADGTVATCEAHTVTGPAVGNQFQRSIDGVVIDNRNRLVRIYVAPERNGVARREEAKPFDAANVLAFVHRTRASQTRGLPPLVAGLDDFERTDSVVESTVISAEQQAALPVVIKKIKSELLKGAGGTGYSPRTANGNPAPIDGGVTSDTIPDWIDTARNSILMLADDQDVANIPLTQPNMNVPPFVTWMIRCLGLGLGMPYEIAFMDMNSMSWSSGKTLITLARDALAHWRGNVIEPGLSQFYHWWITNEIAAGRIPARADALSVAWDWPQLPWPDPIKEEQRNNLAIANGTDSLQRIVGPAWRDILREQAEAARLRDTLAIARIGNIQAEIDKLTKQYPNLSLTWAQVITLAGATSAPGAYLQATAAVDQAASNPSTQTQDKTATQ